MAQFLTIASGYSDLTLGGAELEDSRILSIRGVTLECTLTFETQLREVVSNAAWSLGIVRRTRKLFHCPRVVKSCFNVYVQSSLDYCAPVWMSSEESHLCLLDSIVRRAEKLCEVELCCLGHRRKVTCLVFAL